MRIAFIGGAAFDPAALEDFLRKLQAKHPRAVIVTGTGSPSEKHVAASARRHGLTVEQPGVHPEWFQGDTDAALDWQINEVLLNAQIIVVIGTGKRPKIAKEWWHRMNLHERDKRGGLVKRKGQYVSHRTTPIRLFEIAPRQPVAKAA